MLITDITSNSEELALLYETLRSTDDLELASYGAILLSVGGRQISDYLVKTDLPAIVHERLKSAYESIVEGWAFVEEKREDAQAAARIAAQTTATSTSATAAAGGGRGATHARGDGQEGLEEI